MRDTPIDAYSRNMRLQRLATARHYLMCPPTHFDVVYSINPWMDPGRPTSRPRAVAQWQRLHDVFLELGHRVELIDPRPGLPDMVFAANGATAVNGRVVVARFHHPQRAAEAAAYLEWFRGRGYTGVCQGEWTNEGEGDYLVAGARVLAGTGFRTDPRSHAEVQAWLGLPVIGLTLVDPRYYHLDTALTVLGGDEIAWYPPAFSSESRAVLRELFPDAIIACEADAAAFGLNGVSDGLHVVLPAGAPRLCAQLRERGYEPIAVELSELLKAGGGAKCCTLELHRLPDGGEQRTP
jgi:N-dimethylarginine dimethylaminohydrolase